MKKEFEFTKPIKPNPPTQEDEDIYKERVKIYVSRKDRYEENKDKLYSIIWGQCSNAMQSKLQNKTTFQDIDDNGQCLNLLKEIKGIIFNFETQ